MEDQRLNTGQYFFNFYTLIFDLSSDLDRSVWRFNGNFKDTMIEFHTSSFKRCQTVTQKNWE